MSRVQCLECGIAVVVDPTGVCPEGHLVGAAGVRVAGAMGSDVPHPDEPEPWVATVVLDAADASPVARERTIRPVQIAGADATEAEHGEVPDHESMLRELHALGDEREVTPPSAVPEIAIAPVAEAPPVAHVPAPPQEQVAEGFAELSALEAAFHALGYDDDATPGAQQPNTSTAAPAPSAPADGRGPATPTRSGTGPSDDLADVEGLYASAAPAPGHDQVAVHAPAATPAPVRVMPSASDVDPLDTSAPSVTSTPAEPPPTDADEPPRAKDAGLDIANFTARGGKVGSGRGGRRKLFGR